MKLGRTAIDRRGGHFDFGGHCLLTSMLFLIPGLSGCSLFPPNLPPEVYEEGWQIVGSNYYEHHQEWIAVLDFPQKKVTRIVPGVIPAPDGWKPARSRPLAYSEAAQAVVCWGHRPPFWDVWLYDLGRKRSRWIGHKRWRHLSGFAWSEDGQKLAFLAGGEGVKLFGPDAVPGSVYMYNVVSEKLTEVADDGIIANRGQISSPVWSKGGGHLYYVSRGRHVSRIELPSLRKETLPINAYAVITVTEDTIVYLNDHIPWLEEGCAAQVIKRELQPGRGKAGAFPLYVGGDVFATFVSPSRRFILMQDQRTYWCCRNVLIDTQTREFYLGMWHYLSPLFNRAATVAPNPARGSSNSGDAMSAGINRHGVEDEGALSGRQ
ncbi:MAG: hypothetical protein WBF17_05130 [Phycisphaerae bacterium]